MRIKAITILLITLIAGFSTICNAGKKIEPITLKGVPFDVPNSKVAIQDLCVEQGWSQSISQCDFKVNNSLLVPNFKYGNLTGAAIVAVDEEGALIQFGMIKSTPEILELVTLLSKKYGKPSITKSKVSNNFGAIFDQQKFVWVDKRGTRITVESIYKEINTGILTIQSASMVKSIGYSKHIQNEESNNNL